MDETTERLFQAALALPPETRAVLAERLLDSLAAKDQAAIDAAWGEEAKLRLQAFEKGKIKAIPGDEVMGSFWTLIQQRRRQETMTRTELEERLADSAESEG
jgi:putative addiction module component (TIGR02574 family)